MPAVVVVGREQPLEQAEAIARALHANDPESIMTLDHSSWRDGKMYFQSRRYRLRDTSIRVAEVRVHPDPRGQRVLEQIREREIEQAIDRIRLVHNVESKHVYILCNIPVDITVDRLMTWQEMQAGGSRLEQVAAEDGIVPLTGRALFRMRPDLWPSEKAAQHDLDRSKPPQSANKNLLAKWGVLKPAEFREISTKRWSRLLYDPKRHPNPEKTLTDRLGVEIEVRFREYT